VLNKLIINKNWTYFIVLIIDPSATCGDSHLVGRLSIYVCLLRRWCTTLFIFLSMMILYIYIYIHVCMTCQEIKVCINPYAWSKRKQFKWKNNNYLKHTWSISSPLSHAKRFPRPLRGHWLMQRVATQWLSDAKLHTSLKSY
jgi:hypothetical protein